MQHWIPQDFKCTESGTIWNRGNLDVIQTNNKYLVLDYSTVNSNQIIRTMLEFISAGLLYDLPIIFLRDPSTQIPNKLPKHFAVGLQTSGTTGIPKLIFHSWDKLKPKKLLVPQTWLLCYHPMSFAGFQVILQAVLSSSHLIVDFNTDIATKAKIAIEQNITALSLTPSCFRLMQMCWQQHQPKLNYLTFGGEICDNNTLTIAKEHFPYSHISHIYATTESGVIFNVTDKQAGFPINWLNNATNCSQTKRWQIKIEDNELILFSANKKINTGDRVSIHNQRVYFMGRNDNIANIGGTKVDLEKLENQFLTLPEVNDARVYTKANPITGALICLEVVVQNNAQQPIESIINTLSDIEKPRLINYCQQITLTDAGKKQRNFIR